MRKRKSYLLTPLIFLFALVPLISSCNVVGQTPSTSPIPTELSAPTNKSVPADTLQQADIQTQTPEATLSPTEPPEPTATEPTQKRLPRLPHERPDISMTLPQGDPERGAKLALGRVCVTCHVNREGPPRLGVDGNLPAIYERAALRIEDSAYTGNATTPEEYLFESITDPRIYEVDGDWPISMADNYYDLPVQDWADLIAWMLTFE